MRRLVTKLGVALLPGLLAASSAWAQWTSQTILLRPGWNAVYLEVQPELRACDAQFAGLPVESAWRFSRTQATVQFIDDPNRLVPNAPDWLTWLPATHPLASQSQLFILEGGRPYLIKLADNAASVNWTIEGTPVARKPQWLADSVNLVGFPLPTSNPPTFQAFFTNSPALATNKVYRLSVNGIWVQVNNPATSLMRRGEAFWIRSTGLPDYAGPLELQMDSRVGLDFGRALTEQTLRIRNPSTNTSRTIILRQLASDPIPPSSGFPAKAGNVPLSYWQNDFANNRVGWTNLPDALVQSNVPPGGVWELRLEVRRRDMTPYTPPVGVTNAIYQSLLEVTETANTTRLLVPVMASGLQDYSASPARGTLRSVAAAASPSSSPYAGLWIGAVSINKVSQPSSPNPLESLPVASAFQFRIIVHLDSNGQARLLQHLLQMWKPGQTNAAGEIIDPGRFVLLTDEGLISAQFTGAALRNGKSVGRRFSSAAFGFRDPILMTGVGDFGTAGGAFTCTVPLAYTDPLNPFVHLYHPDHNNLNERHDGLLPEGKESFDIIRAIELDFQANDPDNLALPGWGDTQLGGTYTETIAGLHATALRVQGTFRLQRASRVTVLNDQH